MGMDEVTPDQLAEISRLRAELTRVRSGRRAEQVTLGQASTMIAHLEQRADLLHELIIASDPADAIAHLLRLRAAHVRRQAS